MKETIKERLALVDAETKLIESKIRSTEELIDVLQEHVESLQEIGIFLNKYLNPDSKVEVLEEK